MNTKTDKEQAKKQAKAEMKLLEKLFSHEIEAAIGDGIDLPFQTKSKLIHKLVSDGLVSEESVTLPGRFPVLVKGYQLTPLGHMHYCTSCEPDGDF